MTLDDAYDDLDDAVDSLFEALKDVGRTYDLEDARQFRNTLCRVEDAFDEFNSILESVS